MTDTEIKKALECCSTIETCDQCPLWSESCDNGSVLHKYSLDLINRQQAEIERLQSMNQAKLDTIHDLSAEIEKLKKSVDIHKGIAEDWKCEVRKLKRKVGE